MKHKKFKIDFVIEFYCYLTFGPLPRAPWGRGKKVCSYTLNTCKAATNKFGWIPSDILGGDNIAEL